MRKRSTSNPDSALTETQRELLEREEKLRREMQALERLIDTAPERTEEARKRERATLIERASRDPERGSPFHPLGENPYGRPTTNRRHRVSLKAERNAHRTQFLLLLVVLAVICLIVLSKIPD